MRLAPVAWVQLAAAAAVLVGAFAAWGSLSLVDEQAEIARSTRWIIAGLALAAAAMAPLQLRWAPFAALSFFLVAGVLGYVEMNYEENQAHHYGVHGTRWGLFAILAGAAAGLVASMLRLRRAEPAAPPAV